MLEGPAEVPLACIELTEEDEKIYATEVLDINQFGEFFDMYKAELLMVLCYSMVSDKEAIMSETSFKINREKNVITPIHREDNTRRESTVKRYHEWAKGLWREMFG